MYQMAAFNIQEALIWKEKIEMVIDQVRHVQTLSPARSVILLQSSSNTWKWFWSYEHQIYL
jgi:hypothetical protein